MKKITTLFLVFYSFLSFAQCPLNLLADDLSKTNKEFKEFVNESSGFRAWQILEKEGPTLRTDITELSLVSKNLDAIEKVGGYTKWKGLQKVRDWKSIQKIPTKYPNEPLPSDGELWGIAEIENGLIKTITNKGNTFIDVDFVVTTKGELKIGKRHQFLGNAGDVEAAGTIKVTNGKLKKISNASGHYFPSIDESSKFPEIFKELGIDTKGASLEIIYLDDLGTKKTITKFID
ncbi:hypothetical protein [Flavobacterium geliluteum]|uniref:Uncharacterized protein n=1 Tax=Flavobacterium geliluteum TaxID=2816120 RepID=A0A940X8J0_9FLAO|nr:hypothetical protein [Flavobacterium geliluteum]MBP4137447.1 hypothetical protein [Flavobacterium geliluteum]